MVQMTLTNGSSKPQALVCSSCVPVRSSCESRTPIQRQVPDLLNFSCRAEVTSGQLQASVRHASRRQNGRAAPVVGRFDCAAWMATVTPRARFPLLPARRPRNVQPRTASHGSPSNRASEAASRVSAACASRCTTCSTISPAECRRKRSCRTSPTSNGRTFERSWRLPQFASVGWSRTRRRSHASCRRCASTTS